jgi:hypothetical protein
MADPLTATLQRLMHEAQKTKEQMPPFALGVMRAYLGGKNSDARGTTFTHIVRYMEDGSDPEKRLWVACADYGYTVEELDTLKAEGKTAKDIAQEVVDRGEAPSYD